MIVQYRICILYYSVFNFDFKTLNIFIFNFFLLFWSEDQYKCKSGQCIDGTSTCDGSRDCKDGSDETLALCKIIQWVGVNTINIIFY